MNDDDEENGDGDGDDRRIVDGLRAGDGRALRGAYERYRDAVLAVASAVLGRARAGEAPDVLQDVFVGLARAGRGLRPGTMLRPYLTRAAANRARDVHRRATSAVVAEWSAEMIDVPDPGPHVLDQIEQTEQVRALWAVLLELPDDQRAVVALQTWGNLSIREVAETLGVNVNTVQSRYRYAMDKLRQHFQEAGR